MRWTKKEVATLIRMRENGHKFREISDKLGRSPQAVTQKYHKVKPKPVTLEMLNAVADDLAKGQLELPLEQPPAGTIIWHEPADQYEDRMNALKELEEEYDKDLTFHSPYLKYHYLLAGLIVGSLVTAVFYTL